MVIQNTKELEVYQVAYPLAMKVFDLSKRFPPEERFALTWTAVLFAATVSS